MFLALLYLVIVIVIAFFLKRIVLKQLRNNKNKQGFAYLFLGFVVAIVFVGLFVNQLSHVFIDLTDVFYRKQ
ncbi:hypothetical protein [Mammaliicoccus sp. Dog046]|uniref:hypothetical protein n=1 Tax=Mammaliicoccus sp. Dog046 TaxID=3034233 RepID=UPI002B25AC08|nr:hypothetical protein [Mammaliicoccus sp. Dog046]WQK85042.1 hypothetical protein P3U32_10475 [Mammaliicoccus sp. Dog046]